MQTCCLVSLPIVFLKKKKRAGQEGIQGHPCIQKKPDLLSVFFHEKKRKGLQKAFFVRLGKV